MHSRIRQQFPALQQRIHKQPFSYLDSAATSQKPASVITAIQHYYRRENANVHRGGYLLAAQATAQFEAARTCVAGHFGAAAAQLIWTKGCTEAINLVAQSWACYQLKAGDLVVVSGLEHHANLIPWQQVAKVTGAQLAIIPVLPSGELDLAVYAQLLAQQPKLVAVTHVSNVLGTLNPVAEMIQQAHQVGAKVLVDGAQAAAHLRVDMQQLDADFYVFSGHKMYGPTGIGGLLAKSELLEQFQPWQTGGEMVATVSYQEATWSELPYRLEAGTPHIAGAIGLAKAVEFIQALPIEVAQQEVELLCYAQNQLEQLSYIELVAKPAKQLAVQSFISTQMHAQDVAAFLDQAGVAVRLGKHCAHPLLATLGHEATLRLSLACYSSKQDIDQLILALQQAHQGEPLAFASGTEAELDLTYFNEVLAQAGSWQQRLSALISVGRALPATLKAPRQADHWVRGCESQTWLTLSEQGRVCRVDSDSQVVKGVLHLLALTYNALSTEQQRSFNGEQWLQQSALFEQLSTTRIQGMQAVMVRLAQLQLQCLDEC